MSDAPEKNPASRTVRGVLVEPRPSTPGMTFAVQSILVTPGDADAVSPTLRDAQGALLSVWSLHEGQVLVTGSAFMVAPGLAITAKHVMQDVAARGSDAGFLLVGVNADRMMIWQVVRAHLPEMGDAAVLVLRPRFEMLEHDEIAVFDVTTAIPPDGSRVAVMGIRPTKEAFPDEEKTAIELVPIESAGRVNCYHLHRRPMSDTPVIETSLTTIGAMSGGPVFDESGRVCGVVSSSMPFPEGDYVTYAAVPWFALVTDVDAEWPEQFYSSPMHINSLLPPYEALRLQFDHNKQLVYIPFPAE